MVLVNRPPPLLIDKHRIRLIPCLRNICDRFLQHHASGVDDDVDLLVLRQNVREQSLDSSGSAEVATVDGDVDVGVGFEDLVAELQCWVSAFGGVVVER